MNNVPELRDPAQQQQRFFEIIGAALRRGAKGNMSQQINLFNPALITKRSILSGMNIMFLACACGLDGLFVGGLTWRLRQIQSIESSSLVQMQSLDAQFNQLQVELKMPVHDPVLAGRLYGLAESFGSSDKTQLTVL